MERTQKEYYLREQMKAIQKELGDKEGKTGEVQSLTEKIEEAGMPERVKETALKELSRYEKVPSSSAESSVIRNYIDWLIALPWSDETEDKLDIKKAGEILDKEHHGLEKVKERILEYLAVKQLTKTLKGPILCLAGPPGVGKTSLAKSISTSMGRRFVRISLGGVRDESEIRGHRRTYVGAMPGRIIQGMKKPANKIRFFSWMRSIKCRLISEAIRLQRCLRCWIRNKTAHSVTTILKRRSIYRKCCLSRLRITLLPYRDLSETEWRLSACQATLKTKSWRS